MLEAGKLSTDRIVARQAFINNMLKMLPQAKRIRKRETGGKWLTLYRGISIKTLQPLCNEDVQLKDIVNFVPKTYTITDTSNETVSCHIDSGCTANGNHVLKTVSFHSDGKWDLCVFGRNVDLSKIDIDNTFEKTESSITSVCSTVEKLKVCEGKAHSKSVLMTRYHTMDVFQVSATKPAVRTIRSAICNGVIRINTTTNTVTCPKCSKMHLSTPADKENKENMNTDNSYDENVKQIKNLLKNANPELVSLFIEQSKQVCRDPKGRRWTKSFIGTCVQIYNRSPQSYKMLIESQLLILPSISTILLYKNKVKQQPGFDHQLFEWMLEEAKNKEVGEEGMVGGLIFDEMCIQSDIQIAKNGDVTELIGFTELGEEGDQCHRLKQGNLDQSLGTHILQMLFLGLSGFRFPFAHFVTTGIHASELYSIFWKAVQHLFTYGFRILYTCMDGAVCNRSFMHMCVGENLDVKYNFISKSPTTTQRIIFLMDISHVLKKIRNNILKSGINDGNNRFTRNLTLPNGFPVQWQMFIDAYKWDTQNGLQLNRKLSNEHIFPDSQQKMRNHLAEEVLNCEMLNLFIQYKGTLGDNGHMLNGVIQLLEKTSEMIAIFRSFEQISSMDDPRLAALNQISAWFLEWETFGRDNGKTVLMSAQCNEDIQSCLQGFVLLSKTIMTSYKNIFITPALVNSDVIENIFNQQRSTYNGANTNPNALQYSRTINSILIGQNMVSRKSNAAKSSLSQIPFTVQVKKTTKTEKVETASSTDSSIKVIRA